jgi:hypothetical protein
VAAGAEAAQQGLILLSRHIHREPSHHHRKALYEYKIIRTFSQISSPTAGIAGFPRELSYEDFHRWLAKCRRHDKEMTLKKVILTVKK